MEKLQRDCPKLGPIVSFHKMGTLPDDLETSIQIINDADRYFVGINGILFITESIQHEDDKHHPLHFSGDRVAMPQSLQKTDSSQMLTEANKELAERMWKLEADLRILSPTKCSASRKKSTTQAMNSSE